MSPAELRALVEKAAPGPWAVQGESAAALKEDAALIVAAVNALPSLLDLWEAAEKWRAWERKNHRALEFHEARVFDALDALDALRSEQTG